MIQTTISSVEAGRVPGRMQSDAAQTGYLDYM